MAYVYEYPMPAVTVDSLIFHKQKDDYQILLIQRKRPPFAGTWAIPGGFVEIDEDIDLSCHRELEEETGLKNIVLTQLHTFGAPGRDPRGRTISVAYYGFATDSQLEVCGQDDAQDAQWFSINKLPDLAFDHFKIINFAIEKLNLK